MSIRKITHTPTGSNRATKAIGAPSQDPRSRMNTDQNGVARGGANRGGASKIVAGKGGKAK